MHPVIRVIREHFAESGLSQRELADRIGTTQSAVSDLLGPNANPKLSTLTRLCNVFDVQLAIIGVDDKPEPEIVETIKHVVPNDFTVRVTYGPHGTRTVSIEEETR